LKWPKKKKEQGNTLFKENNLEGAISQWNQAIQYFDSVFDLNPEQKKEVDNIKLSCYTNLAISYLKLKNYEKAKDCSSEALIIDEKNVKALFRRAQSFFYLKNIEAAEKDLKKALTIDPQNVEMKKFLKDIQEKKEEQLKKEKNIYSKMFK
jgi:FK506-binding protein 4/5